MGANEKFGLKEVMDVTLYDMKTGYPVVHFDTLKNTNINITAEKTSARGGRGNPKLITWEYNKDGTLTVEDALLSPKSFELVSGVRAEVASKEIQIRQNHEWGVDDDGEAYDKGDDYPLTASATGAVELAFTPVEAVANIICYEADDDCGTPIALTGATLSGKTLTLEALAGKELVFYYHFESADETQSFTVDANTFAGTYRMVGDTIVRNQATGKDEKFQVVIPNLKWASTLTFNLTADGDPSTQSFECDILKPQGKSTMVQMIKY